MSNFHQLHCSYVLVTCNGHRVYNSLSLGSEKYNALNISYIYREEWKVEERRGRRKKGKKRRQRNEGRGDRNREG